MLSALAMVVSAPVMAEGWGKGEGKGKGPRHGDPEKMIEMMFNQHDSDNDGAISKAEFLQNAEKRFVEIDADKDGNITKEEAKAHAVQKREQMKEKFEKMKKSREESKSSDGDKE